MDKYGSIDSNWYSSESQRSERMKAEEELKRMKDLEKLCKKFRDSIIEKTEYGGIRTRYVKKHEKQK